MTIDENMPTGIRRSVRPAPNGTAVSAPSRAPLVDRFTSGEPYALAFGGQGSPWLAALEEIARDSALEPELTELVNEAAARLAPVRQKLLVVRPVGFDPIAWISTDVGSGV